jgi:hypothetical protein
MTFNSINFRNGQLFLHFSYFSLRFFDVPMEILPEIRSSSEVYGFLRDGPLKGLPIAGVNVHFYMSFAL